MTDTRFTAPRTGWYYLTPGRTPEYLGTDRPTIEPAGTVTIIHFEEGATTVHRGGTSAPASNPSLVIPRDRK